MVISLVLGTVTMSDIEDPWARAVYVAVALFWMFSVAAAYAGNPSLSSNSSSLVMTLVVLTLIALLFLVFYFRWWSPRHYSV
jgi:hypothetical protein